MNKLAILACSMLLATPGQAAAQNAPAPPRPLPSARPGSPAPAPSAQQALPPLTSMPELCRMREQQILGLVRTIAAGSRTSGSAPANAARIQQLIKTERELETSWRQLDCARIFYGAR